MRKFLSVNLLGLFFLSSGYTSMDDHEKSGYEPRKPATRAQVHAALLAAKTALLKAEGAAPKEASSPHTRPKISLASPSVLSLSGRSVRPSLHHEDLSTFLTKSTAPILEVAPICDDTASGSGSGSDSFSGSDDEESWEGSSSGSDEESWEGFDSDDSDGAAPSIAPAPVVKRVTVEEARRIHMFSLKNQSLDLDKKIADLKRREEEKKKKLNVSKETMAQRTLETEAFYLKSASIPQIINKGGKRLTKAFMTPSFMSTSEEEIAS